MIDKYEREIDYLRLSITDMCNFRCQYCIPEGANFTSNTLSLEQIKLIATNLKQLGINKIKLTGGEPLVHPQIKEIVHFLKQECQIEQLSITTNGALLHQHLKDFEAAGLDGITISIDTIDQQRFNTLVKRQEYDQVITNIQAAAKSTIKNIKLNCVPLKSFGNHNLIELCEFANKHNTTIRFIEMMPIGIGRKFPGYDVKSILNILEAEYGNYQFDQTNYGNGPATYYQFATNQMSVGIISAITNKFCENCNKIRITSTGHLKQCLHFSNNINVLELLEQETDLNVIRDFIIDKPKEHAFNQEKNQKNLETLNMSEIGG